MACCLMAPSHYLNQCWLTICGNQLRAVLKILICISNEFGNFIIKVIHIFFRGQWIKCNPNNSLWPSSDIWCERSWSTLVNMTNVCCWKGVFCHYHDETLIWQPISSKTFYRPVYLYFIWSIWGVCCENALKWMLMDFTDDKSTLVQVMAWCCQAPSHNPNQCWAISISLGHIELMACTERVNNV